MSDSKRGSQRPTLLHEPPEAVDWSWGEIALEWAAECGYVLDDWQSWLVLWSFCRQADGLWAARDIGVEVPRQNGKNVWLEVVELAAINLFGDVLVTHSAHRADTSHEHFLSLKRRIEESEELMSLMPHRANNGFVKSHGMESIEFKNGGRILFKARENSSGRGPRPQRIVFDEALVLEPPQVGSMAPGITAQRNPQLLFASSAPRSNSTVLHSLRARALTPEAGDRLLYAAWNNPHGTSVDDRDAWYRVNPSLGHGRMTEESLNANRRLMDGAEFAREHIGIPEQPDAAGAVWSPAQWAAVTGLLDAPSAPFFVGVDATPDRSAASIAIAGGGVVELLVPRPTIGNVASYAVKIAKEHGATVAIDPSGPAAFILPELESAAVEVLKVSGQMMGQACGAVFTAVNEGAIRFRKHPDLDAAVAGARTLQKQDVWTWARRDSSVDVSPLVAATLAWWASSQAVALVPEVRFTNLADLLDEDDWDD